MPLQFIASTCIAQNACVPRLRTSVLMPKRCRRRFSSPFSCSSRRLLSVQFRLIFLELKCSFVAPRSRFSQRLNVF
jgi:hypothetical protein